MVVPALAARQSRSQPDRNGVSKLKAHLRRIGAHTFTEAVSVNRVGSFFVLARQ